MDVPESGLVCDLLWSDPDEVQGLPLSFVSPVALFSTHAALDS